MWIKLIAESFDVSHDGFTKSNYKKGDEFEVRDVTGQILIDRNDATRCKGEISKEPKENKAVLDIEEDKAESEAPSDDAPEVDKEPEALVEKPAKKPKQKKKK